MQYNINMITLTLEYIDQVRYKCVYWTWLVSYINALFCVRGAGQSAHVTN